MILLSERDLSFAISSSSRTLFFNCVLTSFFISLRLALTIFSSLSLIIGSYANSFLTLSVSMLFNLDCNVITLLANNILLAENVVAKSDSIPD